MARVPYTGTPEAGIAPTAPAGGYQSINAQPNDFGAQVGVAEQNLGHDLLAAGNMLGAQAVQTQERYNQVAVQEAYNDVEKQYFDLTYKVNPANPTDPNTNGIYALQGKDAMNAYQPTLDKLNAVREATMGSLRNDAQRIAFQETSRRLQYLTQTTIGRHVDNQMRTWTVATETAGASNAAAKIGYNPGDPGNLASGVEESRARYIRIAQAHYGQMTPEITDKALRDADTSSVTSAVEGFLRQNNPVAAQKFLEDGVLPPRVPGQAPIPVKQAIDPTHHQAQLERVKTMADQNQAASVAGREYRTLVGAGVRGEPLADTTLHSEAQKFLPVLSMGEGNYQSPAPRGDKSGRGWGNNRYQFLARTWDEEAPLAGVDVNDRRPAAQDKVAWSYAANTYRKNTNGRDLQADIRDGGHEQDIASALNKVWPSLPGGKEQNATMEQFVARMRGPTLPTTDDAPERISATRLDNAMRRIDSDPNLSDKAKEAAKSQLITQTSQYHHVLELNAEAAIDDYTTRILKDKTTVTVDQIANDRRLNGHQKQAMVRELAQAQLGTTTGPGPKFTELFQRIHTDDPATRIKSPSELIPYLGNGLTFLGLGELRKEFAGTGTAQGEYIKTAKSARLAEAKAAIIPDFLATPQDKIRYQQAVEAAYQQAAQDERDGVPPAKTWGPDGTVAKLMQKYQGPRAKWANTSPVPQTPETQAAPPPPPVPAKAPLVVGRSYVPDGAGWFKEVPNGTPGSRPYTGRPNEAAAAPAPQAPH